MPNGKTLVSNVFIFVVYVVIAKLSLMLASVNTSVTAVWPPTGIALAAYLIFGPKIWPAIFWGAFAANLTTAGTVLTSLFIALGNTLEAVIGGMLIKKYARGIRAFEQSDTVIKTVIAAVFAPIVSATIGVATLLIAGLSPITSAATVWLTWWLGDATGALIVMPAIVLWYTKPKNGTRGTFFELMLFFATLLITCVMVFSGVFPYPYLIFAVMLWVVFQFGPRETATAALVVGLIGVWSTINNRGPFILTGLSPNTSLILLQIFLAILTTSKLSVATLILERARSQRRFKALIEKSSDAITLIDEHVKILYTSPSTKLVLGYTPEEFEGTPGMSFVHPDDVAVVSRAISKVITSPGKSVNYETRVKKNNGDYVWVSAIATNFLNDPAIDAIVVNYRDISDRKQLEIAKDEFLMISAHHLRSPLTSIRWNIELLLDSAEDSMKKKLTLIYNQTTKMIDLVNEFLDVSRIIQGNTPADIEPTRIVPIIENEIALFRPLAVKKKVVLTEHIARRIPTLLIDATRFRWIIQNILGNALKYTNARDSITITVSRIGSFVEIICADTGIGIPKEDQSHIFSKFFRASNARAVASEGTGLGLFAAREYIKRWNGTITVVSPTLKNNAGTNVIIHIPIPKGGDT